MNARGVTFQHYSLLRVWRNLHRNTSVSLKVRAKQRYIFDFFFTFKEWFVHVIFGGFVHLIV